MLAGFYHAPLLPVKLWHSCWKDMLLLCVTSDALAARGLSQCVSQLCFSGNPVLFWRLASSWNEVQCEWRFLPSSLLCGILCDRQRMPVLQLVLGKSPLHPALLLLRCSEKSLAFQLESGVPDQSYASALFLLASWKENQTLQVPRLWCFSIYHARVTGRDFWKVKTGIVSLAVAAVAGGQTRGANRGELFWLAPCAVSGCSISVAWRKCCTRLTNIGTWWDKSTETLLSARAA